MTGSRTFVGVADVARFRLRVLPVGTIVFARRGGSIATNRKRRLGTSGCCDINLMAVVPHPGLREYLWWWFTGLDLSRLTTGTTAPQLNHRDLCSLGVPLPPPRELRRIVAKVEKRASYLEAGVAALERSRANLARASHVCTDCGCSRQADVRLVGRSSELRIRDEPARTFWREAPEQTTC